MSTVGAIPAVADFRPGRTAALATALLVAGCTSVASNSATFEGTPWQIIAIDDRATPGGAMYQIDFADGRVGGRFGCNQFEGAYAVEGELLIVSDVVATQMGCSEPAASFESRGIAVLLQPMRMDWPAGRRLTLGNAAGTITLERFD